MWADVDDDDDEQLIVAFIEAPWNRKHELLQSFRELWQQHHLQRNNKDLSSSSFTSSSSSSSSTIDLLSSPSSSSSSYSSSSSSSSTFTSSSKANLSPIPEVVVPSRLDSCSEDSDDEEITKKRPPRAPSQQDKNHFSLPRRGRGRGAYMRMEREGVIMGKRQNPVPFAPSAVYTHDEGGLADIAHPRISSISSSSSSSPFCSSSSSTSSSTITPRQTGITQQYECLGCTNTWLATNCRLEKESRTCNRCGRHTYSQNFLMRRMRELRDQFNRWAQSGAPYKYGREDLLRFKAMLQVGQDTDSKKTTQKQSPDTEEKTDLHFVCRCLPSSSLSFGDFASSPYGRRQPNRNGRFWCEKEVSFLQWHISVSCRTCGSHCSSEEFLWCCKLNRLSVDAMTEKTTLSTKTMPTSTRSLGDYLTLRKNRQHK